MACELNPFECEGFVAMDSSYHRISIKSPQHAALLSLREGNTPFWSADIKTNEKLMLDVVRTNDHELWMEDKWKNYYQQLKKRHDQFIEFVDKVNRHLQSIQDPKLVAKEAKKYPFYGVLFEQREFGM